MKDLLNIHFVVELDAEILNFPRRGSLTVSSNVSAILPFNLTLDGILLKYATAQLVTRIEDSGEVVYFFYMPEGLDAEFCLDAQGINHIVVDNGDVERVDDR